MKEEGWIHEERGLDSRRKRAGFTKKEGWTYGETGLGLWRRKAGAGRSKAGSVEKKSWTGEEAGYKEKNGGMEGLEGIQTWIARAVREGSGENFRRCEKIK